MQRAANNLSVSAPPTRPKGSSGAQMQSASCASFVTVVTLSDEKQGECISTASSKTVIKSGTPISKTQKNHLNSKSIVRISNDHDKSNNSIAPAAEESQKVKESSSNHVRSSTVIEISSEDHSNVISRHL
jgi:hypothetical protein